MSKATPPRFRVEPPFSRVSRILLVLAGFATGIATPQTAVAQDRSAERDALAQHHPDLHALLDRIELAHQILYDRLATETLDSETYQELVDLIRVGRREGRAPLQPPEDAIPQRMEQLIRRTGTLHRRILIAYADTETADPRAAAEAAIDDYLSDPEMALHPDPKDMGVMHEHAYAAAFRRMHPRLSGLVWASHWLQLAAYDPFFLQVDTEARSEGVGTVIGKLASKLENPPEGFPTQMPMAPTIAPSLLHWHPRAAGIFDNMNMLHEVVADLLVHPQVEDKRAAIDRTVKQFINPEHRVVEHSDWLRMALRHGIYNQGGPALGTLSRSERNMEHGAHDHEEHMVLPGMGP